MRKKLLVLGITFVMSLALVTGCGGNSKTDQSNKVTDNSVDHETDVSEEKPDTEDDDVSSVSSELIESEGTGDMGGSEKNQVTGETDSQNTPGFFSDWIVRPVDSFKSNYCNGYKWIIIDDPRGYQYFGAVDKSGKLKFYLNKVSQMGPFSDNGKSFFESYDDKFYSVTVDGVVSPAFENAKGSIQILADYSCFCEKLEGFDTNQLKYYIYNPEGTLIREITYESDSFPDAVYYHGNGVFEFIHNFINPPPNSSMYGDFYCGKTDVFVEKQRALLMNNQNGYFTEGDYLLYYLGLDEDRSILFTIIDDEGNWKDIYFPSEFGNNISYVDASDYGILFANNDENYYFLYDVKNNSFKRFDGKYADQIVGSSEMLGNESLAFVLEGSDHKDYLGIYDIESFEMLCEPILAEDQMYTSHPTYLKTKDNNNYKPINDFYFVLGGEHMYYGTGAIYNKKGDAIKTLSNYSEIKYSDGIYQCIYENGQDDKTINFYDNDWNLLFTSKSFDYSTAEEIEY